VSTIGTTFLAALIKKSDRPSPAKTGANDAPEAVRLALSDVETKVESADAAKVSAKKIDDVQPVLN